MKGRSAQAKGGILFRAQPAECNRLRGGIASLAAINECCTICLCFLHPLPLCLRFGNLTQF